MVNKYYVEYEYLRRFRMSASERLHSVKWYRTDHSGNMEEFYTFQPSRQPPAKTYKRKGIRVDVSSRETESTACLNWIQDVRDCFQ